MGLLALPPEIQTLIFFVLPNMKTTVDLRLSCKQLESIYQHSKTRILTAQRERLIAPFTALYECLERLWLPNGAVLYPPPGSWPQFVLHKGLARVFHKSPLAMDIIRHLPCIDYKEQYSRKFMGMNATVINYASYRYYCVELWVMSRQDSACLRSIKDMFEQEYETVLITTSKHLIKITERKISGVQGLYLDTLTGLVFEYDFDRDFYPVTAQEYCDARIATLTNLDEIHVPFTTIPSADLSDWGEEAAENRPYDAEEMNSQGEPHRYIPRGVGWTWTRDMALWVRHLHRQYGWPDKHYDKEGCLKAIEAFVTPH